MKKEFLPFYISRAILSIAFAILVMGVTWRALFPATIFFGLFLLYLHSGWFSIDLTYPLAPLRRDHRGLEIQRKAIILAVVVGMLIYLAFPSLVGLFNLSVSGNVALSAGIVTYFITQFVLFIRA